MVIDADVHISTLIGSSVPAVAVLKAVKTLGARRICFGSDMPFALMHVEVAKYNALLEGEVSDENKYNVMAGNMARLLELKGEDWGGLQD